MGVVVAGLGCRRWGRTLHRHATVHVKLLMMIKAKMYIPVINYPLLQLQFTQLVTHLMRHSFEQESIHRESYNVIFIWDESGMIVSAFNHTPLKEEN